MKMRKLLATGVAATLAVTSLATVASAAEKTKKLQFDKDGEFKVLHLCDCQDGFPAQEKMFTYINYMLENYKPDLVVLGGDNSVGPEETKAQAIEELVAPFVEHKTYFTLVFGNHDHQQGVEKEELLEMYLRQIFLLVQRSWEERKPTVSSYLQEEIDYARKYFNEHYNEDISIEEYAQSRGMSVSWFLRNFKQMTMKSPMQYILTIRINNAVSLLETTDYNVTEISTIIGYDNPLYFSRIFKKQKGVSPSDYRKMLSERTK